MNRIGIVLLLALVMLSSCAATMRLQATAPTMDDDAVNHCVDAPILVPTPAGSILTVWFSWTGPETGQASVPNLMPGALAQIQRQTKAGTYNVTSWAVDQNGNTSCDTTATFTFKGNPHTVSGLSSYTP